MREPVKGRTEAGRRREARARQTRRRIVGAGRDLFLERGYVATTIQAIADRAEVAAATVYQAFGTKEAVLAAALDAEVAGDGEPQAVLDREWVARARREPNQRRQLQIIVGGAAAIAARTAKLKEVVRDAAASEPSVRELMAEDHRRRHETQTALVSILVAGRALRRGLTRARAVDTFFALVNSATYDLLVVHRGWTFEQWARWLVQVIERELFDS
jgi:AcrR family transcriptional regulator